MPEQRFLELRKTLKPEEFNSIKFLEKKAKELSDSDPKLSARILVRVRNLKTERLKQDASKIVRLDSSVKSPSSDSNKDKRNIFTSIRKYAKSENFINSMKNLKQSGFMWFVIIPSLIFSFYQIFIASKIREV